MYYIKIEGAKIDKKFLLYIFIIGFIIFIINIFFYQICIVDGKSMEPTLKNKECVLIKKYNIDLKYNDIIVVKKNNKIIIKRLVALPGDHVKIEGYVYVNNKKIDNLYTESYENNNEFILNEDEYFILGDNRANSIDSRYEEIGKIGKEEIIGKVILNLNKIYK